MTPLFVAALAYLTLAFSTYTFTQSVYQDRAVSGVSAALWPILWLVALANKLTAWALG